MEPHLGEVSNPGPISVWPNQHGSGCSNCAEYRKLPDIFVCGVDQLNAICPWCDVEAARLTGVEVTGRASCSRVKTRRGPWAGTRSRSGIRRLFLFG